MTVLTLPAQPGRDAGLAPLPWRRMVWVTWRQHRATMISVPAVLGAAALFLIFMGLKVHHDYAALAACHGPGAAACEHRASELTSTDWTMANTVLILMNLAPALIGTFAGAPVLGRELESGTFRYAWTQGYGRVRSTLARLVLIAIVLAAASGAVGVLFAWFFGPPMQNVGMTPGEATVFATRGLAFPAWTLTAFAIGVFLGMLIRRVIPAMAVTFGAYLGLGLLAWLVIRKLYLPEIAPGRIVLLHRLPAVPRFWPAQFIEAGWLLALCALLVAGTLWLVRRRVA
jgi:hypothetical protein